MYVRFNEATQLFRKVLSITDQNIRLDGAVVALNSLADMAATQADFIAAENFLQDGLKILQYKVKTEHGNNSLVADQFILLAELKKDQHLFESAKDCYESALNIQTQCYGEVHISVAHTLDYLADLFSERGEQRGALSFRDQSSKIYEALRQQDIEQQNQASLQESSLRTGQGSRARSATSSSVDIDGKPSHGHSHSHGHHTSTHMMSASALNSMAALMSSVASGAPASGTDALEPLPSRALRILTSQYGKNHPRVAMALNNLAKVLSKKGKRSEAQAMLETALSILRKVHGENHPHVAAALHNLGNR
jgi:tetratricopeptide (TPR) repeat protein